MTRRLCVRRREHAELCTRRRRSASTPDTRAHPATPFAVGPSLIHHASDTTETIRQTAKWLGVSSNTTSCTIFVNAKFIIYLLKTKKSPDGGSRSVDNQLGFRSSARKLRRSVSLRYGVSFPILHLS